MHARRFSILFYGSDNVLRDFITYAMNTEEAIMNFTFTTHIDVSRIYGVFSVNEDS
jgi:hypothetical protein